MDVTPALSATALVISAYGPSGVTVAGQVHHGALWLTPTHVRPAPSVQYADLSPDHLRELFAAEKPDVLLIGVGERCEALPPKALRDLAQAHGVVLEAMSNAAACRTWNVLLAEERRVMALLFL